MAHYHSGLPPLDLEPFDPTPLWAATNSTRADTERGSERRRWSWMHTGLASAVALAAGAAGYLLLG